MAFLPLPEQPLEPTEAPDTSENSPTVPTNFALMDPIIFEKDSLEYKLRKR